MHFAVACYRHATNSGFFENRFADCLLKETPKGYAAIMGNAGFHRKKRLRKPARGKARLLSLPPYSPGYNPMEKPWANMKRFFRDNARDFQSVGKAIYGYFGVEAS
jgi:putative transposase